ncbi:MAG: ketoacyl-ACP synthase III [Rubellimicrobium sp.]|nr:ketoacyl-ACP synthase III [Rubellimicrobium sp.]
MTQAPGLAILAAAEARAGRTVTSGHFDRHFGRPPGWAEATTGVATRRFVGPGETASVLATRAAQAALAQAGLAATDLDAILGASGVGEQPIPAFAVLVHRRLGLGDSGIAAFDVNATCLSFLAALRLAADMIAARRWGRVLIVSGDVASAALDMDDPETAPLFGDGAAAVLLGPGTGTLAAWDFRTYSSGADAAWLGAGGSRLPAREMQALLAEALFRMDGKAAFRLASKHIGPFVEHLLAQAGWRAGDIDIVIPHQASGRALDLMTARLGLAPARVMRSLTDGGNMVATSIPATLARAKAEGRGPPGTRALIIGTGAGLSLGGACMVL